MKKFTKYYFTNGVSTVMWFSDTTKKLIKLISPHGLLQPATDHYCVEYLLQSTALLQVATDTVSK